MLNETVRPDVTVQAGASARAENHQGTLALTNTYKMEAYAKPRLIDYVTQGFGLFGKGERQGSGLLAKVLGPLKWEHEFANIVTNVGLNDALDKYLKGSSYTGAFFVGLTDGTPTVNAADTMASHAGWAEVTAYSEGTRPALTLGTVASQSVSNTASKASFSINADSTTIGGAFLATASGKGETASILYSVAAFQAGDKGLDNGDTLNVTVTCTAAAA